MKPTKSFELKGDSSYRVSSYREFTVHSVIIWCKFQLIWTKIEGADMFGVKYLKMSILSVFYERSYQNRELQNAITFERKSILTVCKKPLFSLMEIF